MATSFSQRRSDWRYGALVYQVMVDRFSPSRRLDSKREHYAAPRQLRLWHELPDTGQFIPEAQVNSAEVDFWGGDLESLSDRLGYLSDLGVDLLYLNPIFEAFTNHKYDATDYFKIDPQYGTEAELKALVDDCHRRGMRVMLDGVFNHVGYRNPLFQDALKNPKSKHRELFYIGEQYPHGYRSWRNVRNLPELNLESKGAKALTYAGRGSAVQHYIRKVGIDGWRLDVAPDIGPQFLSELTQSARTARKDVSVIGECWNYPERWYASVDGVLNMHQRTIIMELCTGKLSPARAGRMIERMILDGGIDGAIQSHSVLDNHDTPRIRTLLPKKGPRHLAFALQFFLPGCPVLFYGTELGMNGGADPRNRAPMRWELLRDRNPELALFRKLIALRKENPALRIGDFRLLDSDKIIAFQRTTDNCREALIVVANPSDAPQNDLIQVRESYLTDAAPMQCLLGENRVVVHSGMIEVALKPWEFQIYRTLDQGITDAYSMFKRIP